MKTEPKAAPAQSQHVMKLALLLAELRTVNSTMRQVRGDLETMATVIASYRDRDRLLRKIILQLAPITAGTDIPDYVRDLLIEAGMITGQSTKDDDQR